ncbi:MAG: hypothetical protein JNJ49_05465 [Bdellovibrionaceae bacterium]|nr:hypothetical protein [Pseudobdellovibrionaceae bacterium]
MGLHLAGTTSDFSFDDARLHILPGKPLISLGRNEIIYRNAYSFWKDIWTKVFAKAGNAGHLNADNFLRQDRVCVISSRHSIAGLICFSMYRLDAASSFESGYLSQIPPAASQSIPTIENGLLMTFEYLCVDEKLRNKSTGASIGEILIGLGTKVMTECDASVAVATAVRTVGVDHLAAKFGFKALAEFRKFDLDCAAIMLKRQDIVENVGPDTKSLIQKMWIERIDNTATQSIYSTAA